MICGFFSKQGVQVEPGTIDRMLKSLAIGWENSQAAALGPIRLGCVSAKCKPNSIGMRNLLCQTPRGNYAVSQGEIYNRAELLLDLGVTANTGQQLSDAEILLRLYEAHGLPCIEKINGS